MLKDHMDRCNHCQHELITIDNRGEQLTGCLPCNLWSASGEKLWIELCADDLHALEELRRAEASKMPKVHRSSG
jgi:hypothetical protein